MKKTKNKRTLLEKELTKVFELYIRHRDNWTCITCGKIIDKNSDTAIQYLHAGHYLSRTYKSTKWHEKNVHAQCRECNGSQHWRGDANLYAIRLQQKYGYGILEELDFERRNGKKIPTPTLKDMIEHYEQKIKEYEHSI